MITIRKQFATADIDKISHNKLKRMLEAENFIKVTGFLLWQGAEERINRLYNCDIYEGCQGVIVLRDTPTCMEGAINFHLKLNSHLNMPTIAVGLDGDDFCNGMSTARLVYRFNVSNQLARFFGL